MRHNYLKMIPVLLTYTLLMTGCAAQGDTQTSKANDNISITEEDNTQASDKQDQSTNTSSEEKTNESTEDDYFSEKDLSGEVDTNNAIKIALNGDSISADSDGVTVSGSTVTITKGGTYILTGTLKNGNVIINTSKDEKVQLVLNGVTINSDTFAPIYVQQADKVFVTLSEGTENILSNGGSFTQIDDNNVDAVIFSKDDLTLNGTGTLTINSPAGKGIVGKDEVTIANGTYVITSSDTAIGANDSIAVADGTFKLTSDTDGLHAENKDDDSQGSIYIAGGSFEIKVGDDAIHATTSLQIDNGTFNITAAEGLEASYITINDGDLTINASDDGINAAQKSSQYTTPTVEINGGKTTVVMGAGDTDGIDANGNIVINGGTVDVTGNSTFDYDGTGTINGGTVIANGEEITTLPNQTMGGHGGGGKGGGKRWNNTF